VIAVVLRRLDNAFAAFFRRVKSDETPGYPRFRGVNWFDTVEFPKDGDGCRWESTPHDPVSRVRLQSVGHVRVHRHRAVKGRVKTVSVKREGRRWYVILACDDAPAEPLPATGAACGIDMGIAHFLTTSGGEHQPNPRHGKRNADALAEAQRALMAFPRRKRENRTARHRRAVEKVASLHRRVRRQRTGHAHKAVLAMVRDYDVMAHERLSVANMVRTPKPKLDPGMPGGFLPNGAAAEAGVNKSIHDAGWGVFLGILTHKAESADRVLIPVDPRNASRTCPACGHVSGENRTTQEKFECTRCGHTANGDHIGALNVAIRAGLVLPDVA
jgi:putative transposase